MTAYEIRKFGKILPTREVIHIGFSKYNAVSRCFPLTALFFSRYVVIITCIN